MSRRKILSPIERSGITREEFLEIYAKVPRICVDLVIVHNGMLLLSQREIAPYKWYWHFPGGMVCFRESIDETIRQIAGHELNQRIVSATAIGSPMEHLKEVRNGVRYHSVSVGYLTKLENPDKIGGSFQAKRFKFFSFGNLPEKIIPGQKDFIIQNRGMIFAQ